jgi:hypothetical protein
MEAGAVRTNCFVEFLPTPLWPAGHLPRKEGDRLSSPASLISDDEDRDAAPELLISLLVGEMAGQRGVLSVHAATPQRPAIHAKTGKSLAKSSISAQGSPEVARRPGSEE